MCIDSKHVYTWLSMAVNQSREICSAPNAQQHVTDLALLIQLALLRPLQGDQKVCRLVRHRTMLVQHHTEALQTFTPASQVCLLYKTDQCLWLLFSHQSCQKVHSLVCHGTMLVQHHTHKTLDVNNVMNVMQHFVCKTAPSQVWRCCHTRCHLHSFWPACVEA